MEKTEGSYREKATLLDPLLLDRSLTRLAHEILEHQKDSAQIVLVGIRRRGDILAQRLALKIEKIERVKPPIGSLDITRHRDDGATHSAHSAQPSAGKPSAMPCAIAGRTVILVDDVLFTGRSVRAALDALVEFGRPAKIQLAVLVDRGHREYPIRADYVGKSLPTSSREDIQVKLKEIDGEDRVIIREEVVVT